LQKANADFDAASLCQTLSKWSKIRQSCKEICDKQGKFSTKYFSPT